MDALRAWLTEGGALVDGVEVRAAATGRGVFAARDLPEGAVVIRVPRALLVLKERVRASSLARQLRDANLELSSDHALFAAWLAVERRSPRSPFLPYFGSLPADFSGFPFHAPPAEDALLAGSLTGALLRELRTDLDDDLGKLGKVRLFSGVTRDELVWARLCIGSRTFTITVDGYDTTALVPFADLLNHRSGRHTAWGFDQAADAFTVTTLRGFAAGEELCDSYGAKPNCRLLVHYGFCVDDNPDDEAALCGLRAPRATDGAAAAKFVADLVERHRGDRARAQAALSAGVPAALAGFPTTVADDDAALAETALTPRARDFIRARRGEKVVLAAWRDRAL